MRKTMLATVASLALLGAGAAFAQGTDAPSGPAPGGPLVPGPADQVQQNMQIPNRADMPAGSGAAQSTASGQSGDLVATEGADTYRSYERHGSGWGGQIAGGHTAQDLIGKNVVDQNGESVGEIDDLLIEDEQVTKALVDVGGFMGMGTRTVAIDIDQLQMEQGDADSFVISMERERIEGLPAYEADTEGNWNLMN